MTRLIVFMFSIAFALSGCAGPIETRVQTAMSPNSSNTIQYRFSEQNVPETELSHLIEDQLRGELQSKGHQETNRAPILLTYSIADRLASIGIQLGEEDETLTIAVPKNSKPFQSCEDQEHRLIVTMIEENSGRQMYRGTASEYHCKATLAQTIPHLVRASLSDLKRVSSKQVRKKTLSRRGID